MKREMVVLDTQFSETIISRQNVLQLSKKFISNIHPSVTNIRISSAWRILKPISGKSLKPHVIECILLLISLHPFKVIYVKNNQPY